MEKHIHYISDLGQGLMHMLLVIAAIIHIRKEKSDECLGDNFPNFKQNRTRIAAFGPTTAKAVKDAGLILDITAPQPDAPSMTGALEVYIKSANKIN